MLNTNNNRGFAPFLLLLFLKNPDQNPTRIRFPSLPLEGEGIHIPLPLLICLPVNGLSPSQGLLSSSPPLSGLRPTPLLFPSGLPVHSLLPRCTSFRRASFGSRFGFALLTKNQRGRAHEGAAKPCPLTGIKPWAPSAPTTGGNGFNLSPLQGRDCLPASRSRRERCSSFLPQGRRAPHPLQSGWGFHDLSRGGLPTPAPAGLPDFHPPSLTFRAKPLHSTPSSARRRHPEPSYWPLGYPTPPRTQNVPEAVFCAFAAGSSRS